MAPSFNSAQFLLGARELAQLPPDIGIEVAFAGRSNAGKSSALNALTGRKALARVSRTPGRTQEINVFTLGSESAQRLIDLPGYGYAKVTPAQKMHWQRVLASYLRERQSLRGLVLIVDIRRGLSDLDWVLLDSLDQRAGPPLWVHVLLTKADKLSRMVANTHLRQAQGDLEKRGLAVTLQTFSALQRDGVDDLRQLLMEWFAQRNDESAQ